MEIYDRLKSYEPLFGKYKVVSRIGKGGYGSVFEINNPADPYFKAAVKVIELKQNQMESVSKFRQEVEVYRSLKPHVNIVHYQDSEEKKHPVGNGIDILILMELHNKSLTEVLKNKEYFKNADDIIKFGIDICSALEVVHSIGIHRDIKPDNILISHVGNYILADFGIAKLSLDETISTNRGTPRYSAPEVMKFETIDNRCDIYSLGLVMYQILNDGMLPFESSSSESIGIAVRQRVAGVDFPPPKRVGDAFTSSVKYARLLDVVLKACRYQRTDRFKNAGEMITELKEVLKIPNQPEQADDTELLTFVSDSYSQSNKSLSSKSIQNLFKTQNNNMDETKIIKMGMDICSALTNLHTKGIIYKDVSPENIIYSSNQGFTLAVIEISNKMSMDNATSNRMSHLYVAPEVINLKKVDFSTDLYSLGLVMYQMLNGGFLPFMNSGTTGKKTSDPLGRRIKGEKLPLPVSALNIDITAKQRKLIDVCMKACEFDRRSRYKSAEEMRRELEGILQPDRYAEKAGRSGSKKIPYIAASAIAVVVLAFGLNYFLPLFLKTNEATHVSGDNNPGSNENAGIGESTAVVTIEPASVTETPVSATATPVPVTEAPVTVTASPAPATEVPPTEADMAVESFNAAEKYFMEKDYPAAFEEYKKAAEKNHPDAQAQLGYCYYWGIGADKRDVDKGKEYFQKAADQDNAMGQAWLGYTYIWGDEDGLTVNYQLGEEYLKKSADNGSRRGQYSLGFMYYEGRVVDEDLDKALLYFEKAAGQDHPGAQEKLGYMYSHAKGVELDYEKALELYEKSAGQNNSDAQAALGWMYINGYGVNMDYTQAREWFEISAEQGNSTAELNLGYIYEKGLGVEINIKLAIDWYNKSAEQGNTTAMFNLGEIYYYGSGDELDKAKAKEMYEQAAALGNELAKAALTEKSFN